jgi:hypothetical protein
MLKFLRKYNTLILVVGGSLLMVVFLVPQAVEQIGRNPSNMPYAEIEGEIVSQQRFIEVSRDWQLVNQIAGEAVAIMQIESVDHWMLLLREAEKYGLIGGPTDGALSLNFFADYVARSFVSNQMRTNPWFFQNDEQVLQAVQSQSELARSTMQQRLEMQTSSGRSEIVYYEALAKLRGVTRLLQTYTSLAGNSIPEIQLAAADLYDRVTVDLGVIPASAFKPDPTSLDADAVQAHFEQYRDVAPGEGEFGFGYLLPDAVKYEWIRVNASAVLQSLEAEPADVFEYFRRNEADYGMQTYDEARARVRTDYLNSIARQRLGSIETAIGRERLRATQGLPRDSRNERYRIVPEDFTGPSLETYAQVARDSSGLDGQALEDLVTITPATDEFRDFRAIATSPLGATRYEITARETISLPQLLVRSSKEFEADERVDIQRGLLFGPVFNPVGGGVNDLIFVRITEVREEGPAESIDQLEDRVRQDLATLRGYEELSERAETFREAFADGGFSWFNQMAFAGSGDSRQFPDAVIGNNTVQNFTGDELLELSATALPAGVIDRARTLDPRQPMEEYSADARTASVLMPQSLALGVATIKSFRPATFERLREGISQIEDEVTRTARGLSTQAPYTFASMEERLGFKRLDREDEEL